MKPLFHPAIEDVTVEGILHALSDPTRVAIYAAIAMSGCEHTCSSLSKLIERPIPKSTLSVHFKALRESGLIRSERQGVGLLTTSRGAKIEQRSPALIPAIVSATQRQQAAAGARAAEKPAGGRRRPRPA